MSDSTTAITHSATQRADVFAALRDAAQATGVDFGYLMRTAQKESNFDPTAKAQTSSATGLFQFTNETWLNMVARYGAQYGIADNGKGLTREQILGLRNDPGLSAKMAGELAQENAKILQKKIGRPPTSAELYAAHFMGPTDAAHLIHAARRNDKIAAAETFPTAALANPTVFSGKDGGQLDPAQLYAKLTGDVVAMADSGKAHPAVFNAPEPSTPVSDAVWSARMGVAQLTTSLMNALLDVQTNEKS